MQFFLAFLYPIFFISISTTPVIAASKPRNAILLSEVESRKYRSSSQERSKLSNLVYRC